ncbi:hypothetical protein [Acinetobacter sp.]|jgi:hypothetical protein|uniref:hypothetical protein n=1 Tax=Acinetobacter sp. TaxID=472 RepID=UPI000C0AED2C|nr:hypothetical protein [Acinetobacter sp.]MAK31343.1 hypothetical protein [Acinetobacter sp.]|tara:strand:+ start:3518 stop:4480 length:963 start_codon:yes stop_codon:yes gene_type:complete
MANYTPISPAALVPGIGGDNAAWQGLIVNAQRLYAESTEGGYMPIIASGSMVSHDDTICTGTGTSYAEICRVWVPMNNDNQRLLVTAFMNVDSGDSATLKVEYGGASGTTTTTATAYTAVQAVATPTGSGGREAVISIKGGAASDNWRVTHVAAQLYPVTDPASSPMASGVVKPDAELYTSGVPVTTERVNRLMNLATFVAKDRPATLYSLLEHVGFVGSRSGLVSASATPALAARTSLLATDLTPRNYGVSMYLARDGSGVPVCQVSIGGENVTGTGTGWHHGTISLGGLTTLKMAAMLSRSSGTGNVYLRALQIYRSA